MLEDKFGRRFHYLRLSVTDVCNFSCDYCLPDGYQCDSERNFLTLDEIRHISRAFADLGTSKIRITGGEPALRKDLPEIISACSTTPGIEQIAITTNGFNLPKQVTRWVEAGLTSLTVSIDSFDPRLFKSITGHDKLSTILDGIEIALSLGIPVKINTVLMRQYNHSEIDRLIEWVKDKPITLRFIELMQTGENLTFFDRNHIAGDTIKQSLESQGWQLTTRDKAAGPALEYQHTNYQGKIGLIMPYSKDFCASCNRLRISSIGKLHLCLFAEQGLDIRPLITSDSPQELKQELIKLLGNKEATHWLQDGFTGATKHLAMLGG